MKYKSKYNTHLLRIIMILLAAGIVGVIARGIFLPDTMGQYGHYRGSDIADQKNVELRHGTNDSCLDCHQHEREIHLGGVHSTVSCEFCHGPLADHVKDGKKVASLPVKKQDEIKTLCLRCHNKIIRARSREAIKMIEMPNHLADKNVKLDHTCDQCHHVHSPMLWVNQAKDMVPNGQEGK